MIGAPRWRWSPRRSRGRHRRLPPGKMFGCSWVHSREESLMTYHECRRLASSPFRRLDGIGKIMRRAAREIVLDQAPDGGGDTVGKLLYRRSLDHRLVGVGIQPADKLVRLQANLRDARSVARHLRQPVADDMDDGDFADERFSAGLAV